MLDFRAPVNGSGHAGRTGGDGPAGEFMAALLVGALDQRGVLGRDERTGCRREEASKLGATHRNSVFQLGASNPEKKLRCVASELRIPTRNSESGKEASMRPIGTPYSNSELRIRKEASMRPIGTPYSNSESFPTTMTFDAKNDSKYVFVYRPNPVRCIRRA